MDSLRTSSDDSATHYELMPNVESNESLKTELAALHILDNTKSLESNPLGIDRHTPLEARHVTVQTPYGRLSLLPTPGTRNPSGPERVLTKSDNYKNLVEEMRGNFRKTLENLEEDSLSDKMDSIGSSPINSPSSEASASSPSSETTHLSEKTLKFRSARNIAHGIASSLFGSGKTAASAAAEAPLQAKVPVDKKVLFLKLSSDIQSLDFEKIIPAMQKNKSGAFLALIDGFKQLGAKKGKQSFYKNPGDKIPIWSYKGSEKTITINHQKITKEELFKYNESVKVTHDSRSGIEKALPEMLMQGSSKENRGLAGSRMVGQQVRVLAHGDGSPIKEKIEFQLYTTSARDLRKGVGAFKTDYQTFFTDNGKGEVTFNSALYKKDVRGQLNHFFERALDDKVDVPIVGGFGLRAFLDFLSDDEKTAVRETFIEAFIEEVSTHKKDFHGFVYSDSATKHIVDEIIQENAHLQGFISTTKGTALDVAIEGSKADLKMGILNAGDPSCYSGQDFEDGAMGVGRVGQNFAMEEALNTFTTAHFSANPHMNPRFKKALQGEILDYRLTTITELSKIIK